jgi:thymidine kinase
LNTFTHYLEPAPGQFRDAPAEQPLGRLEVICGPMFAGKTSLLIERLALASRAGASTVAFKHAGDTRYHASHLATHTGAQIPALAVSDPIELMSRLGKQSVVAIDEAHFFGAWLWDIITPLLRDRRRVIIAGVERDHHARPFEPFPRLLVEADEVIKLSGPCKRCGRPAIHSQRLTSDNSRVVVGGAEMYEARCRECFGK